MLKLPLFCFKGMEGNHIIALFLLLMLLTLEEVPSFILFRKFSMFWTTVVYCEPFFVRYRKKIYHKYLIQIVLIT